jgi:hypothetical protein
MQNKTINIKYEKGLVWLYAIITGKNNINLKIRCAIDTACAHTTIRTDLIDALGYSAREAISLSNVISASGNECGYLIKIQHLSINHLNFNLPIVDAYDLPEELGIDALIGNDILSKFTITIDYKNELMSFE